MMENDKTVNYPIENPDAVAAGLIAEYFGVEFKTSDIITGATGDINQPLGAELVNLTSSLDDNSNLEANRTSLETSENYRMNTIRKLGHLAKRSIEGAIIVGEVSPANEMLRFFAYGVAEAKLDNSLAVAGIYTLATLIIEGSAAIAAADVLDRNGAQKTRNILGAGLDKIGLKKEVKTNIPIKAGVAFLGGSAISEFMKDREEPNRTKNQNRLYGLGVSAIMSVVCGVQGYMLSKGIESPSLGTIGGAFIGVGSIFGIAKWARNKIDSANTEIEAN